MSKFNRCVDVKITSDGYEIKCRLNLWCVSAKNKKDAEKEANYYFSKYLLDGEYSSIIGGKSVIETMLENKKAYK